MNMPPYPVTTAATTVAIAVLQTGLMLYVGLGRTQTSTGLGDGGDEGLRRRIRMHGNLAENSALFLVLLLLLELTGDWPRAVPVIGAAFVLARLAHPIGLHRSSGPSALRLIGVSVTALAFFAAAGMLGISVLSHLGTPG